MSKKQEISSAIIEASVAADIVQPNQLPVDDAQKKSDAPPATPAPDATQATTNALDAPQTQETLKINGDSKPPVVEQPSTTKTTPVVERTYAELTNDTMLCFLVEREKFGTDKFTEEPTTEKDNVYQFHPKAFWERVEKDNKGVPRYLRIKLMGVAVKNEEGAYVGYVPFKS